MSFRRADSLVLCASNDRLRGGANGVGMAYPDAFETVLMETSSAERDEDVAHTLGDSNKLLENSVLALRHMLASYKDAQRSTMEPLFVLSLQFIRGKMTLMRTRVVKTIEVYQWEVVDLRNAEVPKVWSDIKKSMRIAEIIATVYSTQKQQRAILNQAEGERCGLFGSDGETVREVLAALD
ncbi:hypothetical protein HDU88_006620 [Geranomyces variabilis]|nr:hypothetical protein HDU88_006620 [Geranomyces variabilis]